MITVYTVHDAEKNAFWYEGEWVKEPKDATLFETKESAAKIARNCEGKRILVVKFGIQFILESVIYLHEIEKGE